MTRNGKIARLPHQIRTQLNRRLQDGEQGKTLVQWLNDLPKVREAMQTHFGGRPISEQNLSEWKQGGFIEWQNRQAACDQLRSLIDLSDDLGEAADDSSIAERLATVLAADLATASRLLQTQSSDPRERFDILCKTLQSIRHLRHSDAAAARERRALARWQREQHALEQKRIQAEIDAAARRVKAPILEALIRPGLAEAYGGETGVKVANFLLEIDRTAREFSESTRIRLNQTQSDRIKPNAVTENSTAARNSAP